MMALRPETRRMTVAAVTRKRIAVRGSDVWAVSRPAGGYPRDSRLLTPKEWRTTLLTVTAEAAEAIQDLVIDHPGAGLRISARGDNGNQVELGLALTEEPGPSDQVIEQEGCRVFVEDAVAPMLDGRTLDARLTSEEELRFTLLP